MPVMPLCDMKSFRIRYPERGLSLVELAVVLLILGLLLGGLLVPLSTQLSMRQVKQTEKTLDGIIEALLGYAVANGHLPCPDNTGDGIEDYDPGTDTCDVQEANLPWATLGVPGRDAWDGPLIYRVAEAFSDRPPTFCLESGKLSAGNLTVCGTVQPPPESTSCDGNILTASAVAVIVSQGQNRGVCSSTPCADERENADGDKVFVSRRITSADASLGEFDDIVAWLSPYILFNRLAVAGKLPECTPPP